MTGSEAIGVSARVRHRQPSGEYLDMLVPVLWM